MSKEDNTTPARKKKVAAKKRRTATKKVVTKKKVAKRKVARKKATTATPEQSTQIPQITPEQRYRMIAEAAYYLAEKRNFEPGYEMEDWITAEKMVEAHIETLTHR